jgi:hypothetical protein
MAKTMKAAVVREFGTPLTIEEARNPVRARSRSHGCTKATS